MNRSHTILFAMMIVACPVSATLAVDRDNNRTAPSERLVSDAYALNAIFGEEHLAQNVRGTRRRAAGMSVEDRYDFLADWVLPGRDHDTIRATLDFTPTHPAPPVRSEDPIDVDRLRFAERFDRSRVQIGGQLIAPAMDLIKVAKELRRLDEVRECVDRAVSFSDQQQRARLAMLVAVDIAREDFDAARCNLNRLTSLVETDEVSDRSNLYAETLGVWFAVQRAETHESVRDLVYHIIAHYVRSSDPTGDDAWPYQMVALMGLLQSFDRKADATTIQRFGLAPPLKQWAPANLSTAMSRGTGWPRSHWQLTPGIVENLAGHGDDYLYFQSPLRGNYAVECDVTEYEYGDSHLSVAGRWVAPLYNLKTYSIGGVRGERFQRDITPRLARPNHWHRLRAVVRDGVCTTTFNGRKIHEEPLPNDHEPWLAIHSFKRNSGVTRNLRITGEPVIPDRVRLTALEDLSGWMPYFSETIGSPTSNWRQLGDLANGGGIIGARNPDLAGSAKESVLYYHRPMLEDGEIEYDFYYEEGTSETHPALDRLAFMLQPRGIRVHWITDGPYDRTQLNPTNLFDEPENRRGPDLLQLKPNSWNRMRLSLSGNTIRLTLNNQLVYQRELESTNQRTFGLFYYSDRTEARVRNVVWRGDWPRQLPPIADQELAGEEADFLDEKLNELTAIFQHDFAHDGLPKDRFSVIGKDWEKHFITKPDGVHVARPGAKGYVHYSLAPLLKVHGDFDITASFDQLETGAVPGGTSGVMLTMMLDREETHQLTLHRRLVRHRSNQPLVQSGFRFLKSDGTRRGWYDHIVEESSSGTLRVARRGKQVYFLFAEVDSTIFRLCGEQAVTDEDLRLNDGIQLGAQTSGLGVTNVVWKNVVVRAERLTGLAMLDPKQLIAEFAKQRDALAAQFDHDFAKDGFSNNLFDSWGHVNGITPTSRGLRVVAPGTNNWSSAAVATRSTLRGNLDIAVTFDIVKLAMSPLPHYSSAFLQVRFGNEFDERINVLFLQRANREPQLHVQTERLNDKATKVYTSHRLTEAKSVTEMRIVRRDATAYVLYKETASAPYRVLCEIDVGTHDIPASGVRLDVHTGGAGLSSEVVWKQLKIRAEKIN